MSVIVADSKIPAIRFKRFSEAWKEQELQEIVDVKSGRDYKHLLAGDIPVYGTGGYMLSVSDALSYDDDAVGIGRKGTIDKPYVLKAPFWTVDTLFYAVPKVRNDLNFVYSIFQKINWRKKDESTGVPSLSKVAINSILAFIANEKEQTQIGNFFQQLDSLIAQNQQKHDKLLNIKKALLEKMFPQQGESLPTIRFKGFNGKWKERELLSNFEKIIDFRGRTPKKLGMEWSDSGYLALSALNVKNGYIDLNIEANYGGQELYDKWMIGNELHKGQVLFTTEAPMGNVAQIPDDNKYILSQRTIAFEVKPELIEENFLAVMLGTTSMFEKLSSLSSGGTAKGVSQKSLSGVDVFVSMNIKEQTKIGKLFQALDTLINQHQAQLTKLNNIKQSFLSKMFV